MKSHNPLSKILNNEIGKTFITGIAQQYEEKYNQKILNPHVSKRDFEVIMENINELLFTFFPCSYCFCYGYLFCPVTLGLSFCFPNICIRDAVVEVTQYIEKVNKSKLHDKKAHLELKIECSTSWVIPLKLAFL